MKTPDSTLARRTEGYEKRPNDFITAKECALIIRGEFQRYEEMKRSRRWYRRLLRLIRWGAR